MKNKMQKKIMLAITLATTGILILSSCKSTKVDDLNNPSNSTKVSILLTDHQSLIYDKVNLNITKLEIKVEDNGVDSLGGWYNLNITPGTFDILRFRNGFDTLFASGTIPLNRKLQKIRMTLGNNNTVVYQGNTFPLEVKDNNNQVVANLDETNVQFTAPNQFQFWIDFDAHQSVQQKSNNRYELKSNIKIFSKSKSGRIEGKVLPSVARAIVLAIKGTDTISALPENSGEFKFVGLNAGTYKLFIDATANSYLDSTINNIIVVNNEDTKVNTIILHQ
jgi:hypothetical protein